MNQHNANVPNDYYDPVYAFPYGEEPTSEEIKEDALKRSKGVVILELTNLVKLGQITQEEMRAILDIIIKEG